MLVVYEGQTNKIAANQLSSDYTAPKVPNNLCLSVKVMYIVLYGYIQVLLDFFLNLAHINI